MARRLLAVAASVAATLTASAVLATPPALATATYQANAGFVTSLQPVVPASIGTMYSGTFTVDWHLEQAGTTVAGTGTSASGTLDAQNTADFTIDGSALADGTYDIVGTITIETSNSGSTGPLAFDGSLGVDKTGPAVSNITASRSVIYPYLNTINYPNTVVFEITVDHSDVGSITLTRNGQEGGPFKVVLEPDGRSRVTFVGETNTLSQTPVPAGVYTVTIYDHHGNPSPTVGTVTASSLHIVGGRTWVHTVSAKASMWHKFVGKCATLRSPSSHRWSGSLGLYANTKCGSRSFSKGGVQTWHSVVMPKSAVTFGMIRVFAYGGAARGHGGSKAVIGVFTTKGSADESEYVTGSKVGWSGSPFLQGENYVFPDGTLNWAIAPARPRNRYDVRWFKVKVTYYYAGY